MLLSMTGYGEATHHSDTLKVSIELRAVNNRHLKVTIRAVEPYNLLEPEVEKIVRRVIRRGTLQVHLRCQRQSTLQDYQLNPIALKSYLNQILALQAEYDKETIQTLLPQLLTLPGVVPEPGETTHTQQEDWPVIESILEQALERLQKMRQEEGLAMAEELLQLRDHITNQLEHIRQRAPIVAEVYQGRLLERIRTRFSTALTDVSGVPIQLEPADLIKEVALFAERSDISEEIVRLASHLDQFQGVVNEPESAGRKLEFLTQEMFRETNTIGSKASDVEVSRLVVEIKATLEKIRELVQNVE